MPDPGSYTVGWICALTTEYVAARSFLDEWHELESIPTNDNNHYTLGRIHKHNVVIVTLPDGEYGISSATAALKDLLRSFPNIRIGLMVGTGGGAPSRKHDIRLGDIVVSAPRDGNGGVFQYDFGKAIQGQKFKATGYLSPPPVSLRAAIAGLKTKYIEEGHGLEGAIDRILQENRRLQQEYKRPEPSTDRLYRPEVIHHSANKVNGAIGGGNDLVNSHPGDKKERKKVVASANQLMKDAALRDRLAAEKDVLCFEMEAAGLMNHFPCLVIRGICNYSDSHKNNEWQGYAAMAAAAYAKDLLYQIAPNKVEAEANIVDTLSAVEGTVNETCTNVQDAKDNVEDLRSQQRKTELNRWLSPPDPSINYHKALQQRHEATGAWFLGGDAFNEWKTRRGSFLWLHGIPGCDRLYSSCNDGRQQPTCQLLRETFLRTIEQIKEIWLVLDALDECSKEEREKLLSWMEEILANSERGNVHLLVTSRREKDIESGILKFTHTEHVVPIQSDLVTDDIRAYVRWRVREGDGLKRWRLRPEVQNEIETVLWGNANGMFRLAACQLDVLEKCFDYRQVSKALKSLPKTLDETYERILRSIPEEHKTTAIKMLQFLTYSERPLKIEEAVDIIAVDTEGDPYFDPKYRMPDHSEILCYCSSLVTTTGYSNDTNNATTGLQLAHFSVKEYLTSDHVKDDIAQSFREAEAKASMAKICLAYLLHLDINLPTKTVVKTFPFVLYCARYWITFAAVAENENETLRNLIRLFFCADRCLYRNCYNLHRPDEPWRTGVWAREETVSALYYASVGGLANTVNYLLSQGADVNAQGGYYGNALQAASYSGYDGIVKLLLAKGADVNAQGGCYGNALQAVSCSGHDGIVELLLAKGADVNAQGGFYGNALQAASDRGHDGIVELLVDKSADVNAQGGKWNLSFLSWTAGKAANSLL
ncbi:uncharacterized protein DFL_007918 [Arthrobotrys flagrans]|uniref:Uncharacterized protein n=1 Tax=Arthrobotrys flagrans TaxID=97331 RepID=A0A436ZXL6_ARTFL|nr:hypothetical protein DFL_007918 [Arthrobotrys flagrans]